MEAVVEEQELKRLLAEQRLKRCKTCERIKGFDEFRVLRGGQPNSNCLDCTRSYSATYYVENTERVREKINAWKAERPTYGIDHHLLKRFSVSAERRDQMLQDQGGMCAICGVNEVDLPRRLAIDHDHHCCAGSERKTCDACVRALICGNCNSGLGFFQEDPHLLEIAVEYLRSFSSVS